jgi:hypothetical protein
VSDDWDPDEPAITFMPMDKSSTHGGYALAVRRSPIRMAILGDATEEVPTDGQQMYDHAVRVAWPTAMSNLRSRNIRPRGEWVMLVYPRDYDYETVLTPEVYDAMEAKLAEDAGFQRFYVIAVVDSHDISIMSQASLN